MEKEELLQLITKQYVDGVLTKKEIKKIIECSKGDKMIRLFNDIFKNFPDYINRKFILTSELMNALKSDDKDVEVHFIDDGNGLNIAYHLNAENYCYMDNKPPRQLLSNYHLFYDNFKNKHKSNLQVPTTPTPNPNECPEFVIIPYGDIKIFDDNKHCRAELYFSIYDVNIVPRRANRINLVMKYIDKDGIVDTCFDTFDPHP